MKINLTFLDFSPVQPTDKAIWMLIGGAVATSIGLVGLLGWSKDS